MDDLETLAKKFAEGSEKIEQAIAKYRVGDFEGPAPEAHAQIHVALIRLFTIYRKLAPFGATSRGYYDDAFMRAAGRTKMRLFAALREAERERRALER